MEYRFFQYGVDDIYIKDIVDILAISHHEVTRTEKWFQWRFEQNPCGKAILSCAFESGQLVACIVIEKVPEIINGKKCIFGMVRYISVRDGYDPIEIIPRLIRLAESEVRRQQLDAVLILGLSDYCSDVSIDGWKISNVKVKCRVKFIKPLRSIFRLSDITKPLIPIVCSPQNKKSNVSFNENYLKKSSINYQESGVNWDIEYLCWRFNSTDNTEYIYK